MPNRTSQTLSKTRFLSGLQCAKRLWTEVHARHRLPPVDPTTQARFDQGHTIGSLAQRLYPDGLEVAPGVRSWDRLLEETAQALVARRPLFEPAFRHRGAACRVDILVPVAEDEWDVVEVKSSTSVKRVHVDDLALQASVLEGSGLRVRSYSLAHIDTDYVRQGELDIRRLFALEDLTTEVRQRAAGVEAEVDQMLQLLAASDRPEVVIGQHCLEPYACPLIDECWSFLPAFSVFDLVGGPQLAFERLAAGTLAAVDLPADDSLDERQRLQLQTILSGTPHVDTTALRGFLATLEHPVHYFDIESFSSAVPPFDGVRPYQQIPFLFSIHRVEAAGEETRHYAYRFQGRGDPRADLLRACRSSLGEGGSIVAFNAPFEKRILRETAESVAPELVGWVAKTDARFVDLWTPFRRFAYHHPQQKGSASLKAVLEPLTGMTYAELEIADGERASIEYRRTRQGGFDPVERARILRELERYCSLDTLAMVAIVDSLAELAHQSETDRTGT